MLKVRDWLENQCHFIVLERDKLDGTILCVQRKKDLVNFNLGDICFFSKNFFRITSINEDFQTVFLSQYSSFSVCSDIDCVEKIISKSIFDFFNNQISMEWKNFLG